MEGKKRHPSLGEPSSPKFTLPAPKERSCGHPLILAVNRGPSTRRNRGGEMCMEVVSLLTDLLIGLYWLIDWLCGDLVWTRQTFWGPVQHSSGWPNTLATVIAETGEALRLGAVSLQYSTVFYWSSAASSHHLWLSNGCHFARSGVRSLPQQSPAASDPHTYGYD